MSSLRLERRIDRLFLLGLRARVLALLLDDLEHGALLRLRLDLGLLLDRFRLGCRSELDERLDERALDRKSVV